GRGGTERGRGRGRATGPVGPHPGPPSPPLSLTDQLRSLAQRSRDLQTENIRRRDVDDHVELDGLLYGQITGSSTAKDPVHIPGRSPAQLDQIDGERHQAAIVWKQPVSVNCRQSEARGEPHERAALATEHRVTGDEQRIDAVASHRPEDGVELARRKDADLLELEAQSRALLFNGLEELRVDRIARIPEERDALRARSDVTQHFEALLDRQNTAAE